MAADPLVLALRRAVSAAHRRADQATTALWRAHRDALLAERAAQAFAPRLRAGALRTALLAEVTEIERETQAAEAAAYDRRARLRELVELLGVDDHPRGGR